MKINMKTPTLLLPMVILCYTMSQVDGFNFSLLNHKSNLNFNRSKVQLQKNDYDTINKNINENNNDNMNSRRNFLENLCTYAYTSASITIAGSSLPTSQNALAMETEIGIGMEETNISSSTATSTSTSTPSSVLDDSIGSIRNSPITNSRPTPKKPFAPLQALLPAARVKLTIENALHITNDIIELDGNGNGNGNANINDMMMESRKKKLMSNLEEIILINEQKGFMKPFNIIEGNNSNDGSNNANINTNTNTNASTNTITPISNSKLNKESYKEKFKNLPLSDKPLAVLSEIGDKRQFNNLQKRQRYLETKSPIRTALNYYTRRIQFNTESYVLNASAEDKKRMIRNDSLPDIKSVIVSDLDLRDLVRNQILDAYDDVRAELQYQIRNYNVSSSGITSTNTSSNIDMDIGEFDLTELRVLLLRAQRECDRWFSFIDENDVQEAMDVVSKESSLSK